MEKKRSLFFDTSLIYFVVIALFCGVRILSSLVKVGTVVSNLLSVLIQVGFMLLVPFFMYKLLRKKKTPEIMKEFHVKKINFKAVLICIGMGVLVYFLTLAVNSFFSIFITSTGYDPSFGMASNGSEGYSLPTFLADILLTAILPGICEEFCHRGLLVNGYKQMGSRKTILLVGLLFGLMHLNIEQFFYASVVGMFLTFLVYVTDSIVPSMIIHFLNNSIGLYLVFANENNLFLGNFSEVLTNAFSGNVITVFGTIILVIVLMLGALIGLIIMLLKQTCVKDFQKIAQKALANKQREELLESFNLDIEQLNKEQGIEADPNAPQVVFSEPRFANGRQNVMVDFIFNENNLMATRKPQKPSLKDKAFLFGTIFIGIVITICTLIWGIL